MRSLPLAAALLLLAGCAAPTVQPGTAAGAPPPWTILPLGAPCPYFCEPSLAALPDGSVAVLSNGALSLAPRVDAAFAPRELPKVPREAFPGSFQNDGLVQAGPDGRLYFSALLTYYDPQTQSLLLDGLQVASSADGGKSWDRDAYLGAATTPTHPGLGADRQWLTFGKPGEVYLSYQQVGAVLTYGPLAPAQPYLPAPPGSMRVAASSDGGATFTDFREASAGERSYRIIGAGATDAGGRLAVPYNTGDGPKAALSDDHGATFRQVAIAGGGADFFPRLETLADGSWAATWKSNDERVLASVSADRGEHWSAPTEWGANATSSPWLVALPGGFGIAWLTVRGEGAYTVMAGREQGGARSVWAVANLTAPKGARSYTDFVHAAALPDGRMAILFADTKERHAFLAVAPA
jgi:hypothetical protein